ncbi:hypothetical protein LINPERPRIM_LOCUS23799 [Linum perenne]
MHIYCFFFLSMIKFIVRHKLIQLYFRRFQIVLLIQNVMMQSPITCYMVHMEPSTQVLHV